MKLPLARTWIAVGTRFLPFADVASPELSHSRLLRLSLFQVTVGMAAVLLIGTLNRVMIVELRVPAGLVSAMVAIPLFVAPFRALVGFRSDMHRSVLGWRRVPYIWMGTLLQFGGLAIMPFALIVLSGDTTWPPIAGRAGAALAFLLLGAGLHTVQTAGLALATDISPPEAHPRVVAWLCVMMLLGMIVSALLFGLALSPFSEFRLIQVIQGSAALTMALNLAALWKQEGRNLVSRPSTATDFSASWHDFIARPRALRQLLAIGLGTVAFSMQDVLLEPYGGQVLHLPVSGTTRLTALLAAGGIAGFLTAARLLTRGGDPWRVAALGALTGLPAFAAVIFAAPLASVPLFALGVALIGTGGGLFAVGTLTAAMRNTTGGLSGLALGAWGAVQATAAGCAVALGGLLRDGVANLAASGRLGPAFAGPAPAYSFVYHLEIALLFATLVALGPLVSRTRSRAVLAGPAANPTIATPTIGQWS
jgi:BCD family chlorophyll transporter-like MFS transporter